MNASIKPTCQLDMPLDDYMTVAEAAEAMGLKYKTLLKRINTGSVVARKFGGRMLFIEKNEVNRIKALKVA